jgi:hypothetical protein
MPLGAAGSMIDLELLPGSLGYDASLVNFRFEGEAGSSPPRSSVPRIKLIAMALAPKMRTGRRRNFFTV